MPAKKEYCGIGLNISMHESFDVWLWATFSILFFMHYLLFISMKLISSGSLSCVRINQCPTVTEARPCSTSNLHPVVATTFSCPVIFQCPQCRVGILCCGFQLKWSSLHLHNQVSLVPGTGCKGLAHLIKENLRFRQRRGKSIVCPLLFFSFFSHCKYQTSISQFKEDDHLHKPMPLLLLVGANIQIQKELFFTCVLF